MENQRLNADDNIEYDTVESIFVVSGMTGVLEDCLADGIKILV